MKKALVTGSSGFVGKPLVKKLKRLKYKVIEFDRTHGKNILNPKDFKNIANIDLVFHLAAVVGYVNVQKNPLKAYQTNVLGTVNVLDFCRQQKAKLVFASSYIYGPPYNKVKKESDLLKPLNLYTQSKYFAELFCQIYAKKFKTKTVILRISNLYGPHQPKQYIISLLIDKLKKEKQIILTDPKAKRDFIFIDDLVNAYIKLVQTETEPGEIFNLSSGQPISLKKLATLVKKLTGSESKIKFSQKLRKNEVSQNLLDNSKFCQKTGWQPQTFLEEGLKKTMTVLSHNHTTYSS